MKSLEEEGYELIGYIRKSKGKDKEKDDVLLLETMAIRLTERCSVKAVYASFLNNRGIIFSVQTSTCSLSRIMRSSNFSETSSSFFFPVRAMSCFMIIVVTVYNTR